MQIFAYSSRIHALTHFGAVRATRCSFSWKSRQKRDPDLRAEKLKVLEKRYTLRRIGELKDSDELRRPVLQHLEEVSVSIRRTTDELRSRIQPLISIESLNPAVLGNTQVGSLTLGKLAMILQPNPRTLVLVARDRGSVDLILKTARRANPICSVSILDRERVEVKLPPLTDELKLKLGSDVERLCKECTKQLKKTELLKYKELVGLSKAEIEGVRWSVKLEFEKAEKAVESILKTAIDELGLETYVTYRAALNLTEPFKHV